MQKNSKRVISLLLVMILLLTTLGAGISAFFTGKDAKKDTYTIGKIEVEVVGEDDLYKAEHLTPNYEYEFTRAVHNIGINDAYVFMTVTVPFDTIYTHYLDGNQVEADASELTHVQLFSYGTNGVLGVSDEWKLVTAGQFGDYDIETVEGKLKNTTGETAAIRVNDTITYIYGWVGSDGEKLAPLAADETTGNLFDTMKFANVSDTDANYNIEDTAGQIITQAYAIQTQNVLETEYMTGNNLDGTEMVNSVWYVINNALVRTNDVPSGDMAVVYVGEKHIVQPSLDYATGKYGQALTTVYAVSDTDLYNELVNSDEYHDISKDQNMDVIGGVITTEPISMMGLRDEAVSYGSNTEATYMIVAKDNTIIMAPDDMSEWFINLIYLKDVVFEDMHFNNTSNMSGMFQGCTNLQQVVFPTYNAGGSLNSQPNYSNVSNVTNMFNGCTNLGNANVEVFENIQQASGVFNGCENLTEVDLSSWEYVDVTWLTWLFQHSTNLDKITISASAMQNIQKEATQEEFEALQQIVQTNGTLPPVEKVEGEYTQLITGPELNNVFKSINSTTPYTKIRFVKNSYIYEQIKALDNYQDVSADGVSAFVGVIGDTCYVATPSGKTMYAPVDSSYMFYCLDWVTVIDVRVLDTSDVTNMSIMFYDCKNLTQLDLSSFNTSSLTSTRDMFYNCQKLTAIYVSGLWNMSNVNNSNNMFYYCGNLVGQTGFTQAYGDKGVATIDKLMTFYNGKENAIVAGPNFNALLPSNTTEVYIGDYHNNIPESGLIDLSVSQDEAVVGWSEGTKFYITTKNGANINTTGSMCKMFNNRNIITTISFDNINTAATFNMSHLFGGCTSLVSLDIQDINTVRTTNMSNMFSSCTSLSEIDVSHFNTSNVTSMTYMFYNCINASKINVSGFDTSKVVDMSVMFYDCKNLIQLDLSSFDTSSLTSTRDMFYNCQKLTTIYVSELWDMSNVNNSNSMFYYCGNLVGQTGFAQAYGDKSVATIDKLMTFYNGKENAIVAGPNFNALLPSDITEVYIGDYSDATPANGLIDFSANEDWSVIGWRDGTKFYITSANGDIINTTASMYKMFNNRNIITTIVFDNIDTSDVVYMQHLFNGCSALTALNTDCFDTSNVALMSNMFSSCTSLSEIDVSHFNTSNVTSMTYMFYNCINASKINVSGFDTSKVTDMSVMFYDCKNLIQLDLSSFDTGSLTSTRDMFYNCQKLTTIYVSELWDMANVNNFSNMFYSCNNLVGQTGHVQANGDKGVATVDKLMTFYNGKENVIVAGPHFNALLPNNITEVYIGDYSTLIPESGLIDLSANEDWSIVGWCDGTKFYVTSVNGDVINTTASMHKMFNNRNAITTIVFDNIDTSDVIYMHNMFSGCSALTVLNIDCFDTSNVANMNTMFYNCLELQEIDLSHFNTSNVTDMHHMFYDCVNASKINVSGFDTSKVVDMSVMFYDCKNLIQLDLSSFNTSSLTNTNYMFYNCQKLTTIYVSELWDMSNVNNSNSMFYYCYNLVGQTGFTQAYGDKGVATIDKLLTYKEYIPA